MEITAYRKLVSKIFIEINLGLEFEDQFTFISNLLACVAMKGIFFKYLLFGDIMFQKLLAQKLNLVYSERFSQL